MQAGLNNANYTVVWNTGQTSQSISVSPGQYFYTATSGSCVLFSDTVTVFNQTSIIVDSIVSQISCFGLTDASIDLTVNGGVAPYSYSWQDSVSGFISTSDDLTNLSEGVYHCFITDFNGCEVPLMSVIITEPQPLSMSSTFTDVSCYSLNDGTIDLNVSGGIPPYSVIWTSVNGYLGSGESISNLPPDIYTATITDANNCGPIVSLIAIIEPSQIILFGIESDISCFGMNDGAINLTTTGNNLSFSWSGPSLFSSNMEDISNLIPGIYTINLIDDNSCVGPSANYTIVEPSDIVVTTIISNVSCYNGNDGSIDLTITGGAGNYTTIWTGTNSYFSMSEDIFTLSSGMYTYSVTDANGCSPTINNSPLITNQPPNIQFSSVSTDESCYGDADGTIDVTLTPLSNFSFSWVGPNLFSSNLVDISSLVAGTYNLIVTDVNNCTYNLSEVINIGNIIVVDTFVNDISCNGLIDGNIVLLTPNSVNPTFNWSGPNSFTSSNSQIFNLENGLYSVVINDNSNCPTQLDLNIYEPLVLSSTSLKYNESCNGYQDGSIEIFVNGGTPNYTYVWNNGNNSSLNSNLLNGEYILNIIDANNCIITDTFRVDLFLFDTTRSVTNVSCYGGSNGVIDLEIVGGTPPFLYNWNTSDSTQDLINISSAVYTVNITDATNCTIIRDVIVTEPQQLAVVSNISIVLCYGDTTGTVTTQINGGVFPYLLDWGTTDTSAMFAEFHTFTVTDANNCKFTDSIQILQNDSMQMSETIINVQCYGDLTGSVLVQIAQGTGTPPYSYSWSGPNNYSSSDEDIFNLEAGNYLLTVTDNNLCVQQLQVSISQPQQISQTTSIISSNYNGYNVRCKGENSAWVEVNISSGYPPYSYLWDNGNTEDSIFNLYAGSYSLEVTDSLGCVENLMLNLNEPATYVSATVQSTSDYNGYNISCFGFNDGSVFVEANNGISPYTYLWNTNDIKASVSNLYSDYYEVFVYDKNMCLAIDSLTLTQPTELFFDLFYYQDTCNREVGKSEFVAEGGIPNYSALWSNASTDIMVDNLSQGNYSVEVSDANSCVKTTTFTIDNLESPIADFEAYPYHKRFFDQKNEPFFFVDLTNTFWSSVKSWTWSFGDGFYDYDSLVSHIYEESGEYVVHLEIETYANCIDTISKKVLVDEYSFYIPNSFIPSSNEVENSIFKGYGIGIKNYELKIFSRWGELIFETQNLEEGWDGTYHNNENICPIGVYTYSVFIENIYGEIFEYQGQVKLLR